MRCLFCGDRIEEKADVRLGEWKYIHTSGHFDHPAVLAPEPMTELAWKEKAWFETWGFRRKTRSTMEESNARMWFNAGWKAKEEWDAADSSTTPTA